MNTPISPATHIIIKGARQHNLKNIDLELPKNKFIVFTGLSGSGKSSLAFDTIYAEGQRRYVESLSSYARQFLGLMQKPDVDQIDGLSPAISIDQKTTSHNPRSTVGTITEIYDYLRLLFARVGHPHCPDCNLEIAPQSVDQITQSMTQVIQSHAKTVPQARFLLISPVVKDKKGEFTGLFENLRKKGFDRVRIDGRFYSLDEDFVLIKTNRHSISAVIDRLTFDKSSLKDEAKLEALNRRLAQGIESALALSQGQVILSQINDQSFDFPANPTDYTDTLYSQAFACPNCGRSFAPIEPRLFSFNTPHGACLTCTGLGSLLKVDPTKIIAPDLTLSEGAIIPLSNALSSDSWYARKLKSVVESEGSSYTIPYHEIPQETKDLILYGSHKYYHVSGDNRQGRTASFSFQHEGVVNELERRYLETQSDFIRTEIGRFMKRETCPDCKGARLKPEALSVTIAHKNINHIVGLAINKSIAWINALKQEKDQANSILSLKERAIATPIIKEINSRLDFLSAVGLEYLTLNREAATLAGGEAQRIRLASQIGTGLTGVLYVLDEPTIGLHPRDNLRLISTLTKLRDLGNTVVVEHDQTVMEAADILVDFGPRAGAKGGQIVTVGTPKQVKESHSLTGLYLSGQQSVDHRSIHQAAKSLHHSLTLTRPVTQIPATASLNLKGVSQHNLKNIDVDIPLNKLVCITGVSGSGKSSLMHDTLYPALKASLGQKVDYMGKFTMFDGAQWVTKALLIDQSPIGKTPRSNPATYTKAFDHIRQIFASTALAKAAGFKPGRFSFNVKGGRCENCQGGGEIKISMQFLADIYVTCDVCQGKRYNQETLAITYKNLSIAQVLDLTIDQALDFFKSHSLLTKKMATLKAVGLGYLKLGQPAPTLSGGEAQRVKLAKELSVAAAGHTVYLLDEPTTGLHFEDVKQLMVVLRGLVDQQNTVVVIEHNLDVIKNADWIIDLGPEGGDSGGHIVATGKPQDIAKTPQSHTAHFLKPLLTPH